MARKKITEVSIEGDDEAVVAKVEKNTEKGMARVLKALGKINGMQIEVISDYTNRKNLKSFHSGCSVLDTVMGFKGFPYGKFIEIFGKESSGKSTLAMHAVNSAVNDFGGYSLILDVENNAWEFPKRSIELGLKPENLERVTCCHPATTEDAMNAVVAYIEALVIDNRVRDVPVVIVWDSIAANTSQDEQEKDVGNIGYLTQSRVIAQAHRKLVALLNENNITNVTFIWLNQAREAQNKAMSYLPPTTVTFGGKAPAFYSAIRIEVKAKKNIAVTRNGQKVQIGVIITAKTVKNKLYFAKQSADIIIMFASGIDDAFTAYEWLKLNKLLKPIEGEFEAAKLVTEDGTDLLSLKFSKLAGFRRIFNENKDAFRSGMKKYFDDLLSSCSNDMMSADTDEDSEQEP
jgi:recombination protein RecA